MQTTMLRTMLPLLMAFALPACSDGGATVAPGSTGQQAASDGPTTIASGLVHPWGMVFLPDGAMLVTERPGRLRRVDSDGTVSAPIEGVPEVFARGQGGLLDVQLSPEFRTDQRVYLSYSEPGEGGVAGTAVARGVLDGDRLRDVEVIFRQQPKLDTAQHFGSRLVFDGSGHLFVTLGDRGHRPEAQNLSNHIGTVVRILPDGSVPADNPFNDRDNAEPGIWSYGHRNVQAAAINPWSGELWAVEHGPRGGDEVNRAIAGENYGWPRATHGIDYSGRPIPEATGQSLPGMVDPLYVWERSPGVSGMAFYDHQRAPQWRRNVFVGALADRALIRLTLDGDAVSGEQRLLEGLARIRDVEVGPDGALYLLTDEQDGKLLRLDPPTGG